MNTRTPCVNSPHVGRSRRVSIVVATIAAILIGAGATVGCAARGQVDASTPARDAPSTVRDTPISDAPPATRDLVVEAAQSPSTAPIEAAAPDPDPFAQFELSALDTRAVWYDRWPALAATADDGGLDCAHADFRLGAEVWVADLTDARRVVGMLCQPGAYNFGFALFDVRLEGDAWQWQPLELPRCGEPPTAPQWQPVYLPTWDADTRTLRAFAKARGLGDCGETEAWTFDGAHFCLARCAREHECNERLPPEWEPLFVDPACEDGATISP